MSLICQEHRQDVTEKLEAITSGEDETPVKSLEEEALVRKIDLYLMPSIWLLYPLAVSRLHASSKTLKALISGVQYMDRSNIGNAKSAGMEYQH
jgi:hypothetical protein